MQTLARVLGIGEFVLVPVSIVWLLLACVSPSRRRAHRSIALALVLAFTVAQPFGIVADTQPAPPPGARAVDATSVHVARLFGFLPVLPFVPYHEDYVWSGENRPTAALKARSWFWVPILVNATTIKDICSNDVFTPCWGPGHSDVLTLTEHGGRYYATLVNSYMQTQRPVPGVKTSYTWELHPGIASLSGLIYWGLLAVLIPMTAAAGRRHNKQIANQST